tara:strand:+ start:151 stop:1329 length:1179 start_codon:yes stop_codon:yes gene_type:complete
MAYISMSAPADSFSFTFENISNQKRSIELFQLGLTNVFTPIEKTLAKDFYGSSNPAWLASASYEDLTQFFKENPANPFPNGVSNDDCLWETQSVTTRLAIEDILGNIYFVDLPTTYSGDIDDFNAELQNLIDSMVTAGLTPPIQARFTFNGVYGVQTSSNNWKGQCFGLVLESDSTTTNLDKIYLEQSGVIETEFAGIKTWFGTAELVDLANQVIIKGGSGTPYTEIERSQIGAFLDIRAISVQVLPSSFSTQYTQNSQNLNSLGFFKMNINGDDYSTFLNPTISPYQYQNVIQDIDMDESEGLFVLDGNTRFDYDINAWTKVELTFDYVQFPNFLLKYGYKVAEAIIDVRQAQQDMINYTNNYARDIELDIKEEDFKKAVKMLDYARKVKK